MNGTQPSSLEAETTTSKDENISSRDNTTVQGLCTVYVNEPVHLPLCYHCNSHAYTHSYHAPRIHVASHNEC
ncbi:hypothetical protein CYMTET_14892 [Cymbomonas tetramitiformis]|uniref:Uncharacterized protein n=1 Tax=Cymbomonas tetramitiformis TaxID=36881 RepID=A0AAE0GFL7_9CHLO|nr:hypothetical protein CYMTET_14892 [Cymbomonas tetramitiformis]